jgi:hypothetical protein
VLTGKMKVTQPIKPLNKQTRKTSKRAPLTKIGQKREKPYTKYTSSFQRAALPSRGSFLVMASTVLGAR